MKYPKAKKLPSGSWFCRVRVDGKDIAITRPTEKEAVAEAMALKAGLKEESKTESRNKTVTKAIDEYIAIKQDILSPATIRGYRQIQKHHFQSLMQTKISSISKQKWQAAVNAEAKKYSAKTLNNAWGFMSSVIQLSTGKKIELTLPQEIPNERPFFTVEEIKIFLKLIEDKWFEIPALLALSSLRRSEIIALDWKHVDLKKDQLRVQEATVPDENHKLTKKKETKNRKSRRPVPIMAPLHKALEKVENKTGLVVPRNHTHISEAINKLCRENGLPEVGLHGLRHSFASLAKHLKIPEEDAMEIGGWADLRTMKKIYTHIYKQDREEYGKAFTDFFLEDKEEQEAAKKP